MRIVVLDAESMHPADLNLTPWKLLGAEFIQFDHSSPDEVLERIVDAEMIILNKIKIGAAELAVAKRLKLIAVTATGTNNIDLLATKSAGVTVINAVNYGTQSVVQHTLSLIFALAGNLLSYANDVAADKWSDSRQFCSLAYPITEISELTLGIVGYGVLGQELARQAKLLGMRVIVAQSVRDTAVSTNRVPLKSLLSEVDVLSLHCPLTEQTVGLIGDVELAMMKPSAILVNCARGGIVCEDALVKQLNSGHLGGIGFDVLAVEPPLPGHPLTKTSHPNVIITPHMAWGSRNARQTLVNQLGDDMKAFVEGKPLQREVSA